MKFYRFYNQYRTMLYQGEHANEYEAWQGFFEHCKYPEHVRDIDETMSTGIYYLVAQ